jgi:hypothetical protein
MHVHACADECVLALIHVWSCVLNMVHTCVGARDICMYVLMYACTCCSCVYVCIDTRVLVLMRVCVYYIWIRICVYALIHVCSC